MLKNHALTLKRFIALHVRGSKQERELLNPSDFVALVMDMGMITLTHGNLKAVMQDLRSIDTHNATIGCGQGCMACAAGELRTILDKWQAARDFRSDLWPCVETKVQGNSGWCANYSNAT